MVKTLVEQGSSIASTNKIGNTPLHCAAIIGSLPISKMLIEAKANVQINQPNKLGFTPLAYAQLHNRTLAEFFMSFLKVRGDRKEKKEVSNLPKTNSLSSPPPLYGSSLSKGSGTNQNHGTSSDPSSNLSFNFSQESISSSQGE